MVEKKGDSVHEELQVATVLLGFLFVAISLLVSMPSDVLSILMRTGIEGYFNMFISYSFFVTTGKLSDATTGGKPVPFVTNNKLTDLSSDWTPAALPEGIGGAAVWIVVHDDRGGVGWTALQPSVVE